MKVSLKKIIILFALTLLACDIALAQDPGVRDTIIIGTVYADSGVNQIEVPVYFYADDTVTYVNFPLKWNPPDAGVTPIDVVNHLPDSIFCPVLFIDSIMLGQNLIRMQAYTGLPGQDSCAVFPNFYRGNYLSLIFSVDPLTPPTTIAIDTTYDPRNHSCKFGLIDGHTEFRPIVTSGHIYYGIQTGIHESQPEPQITEFQNCYPNPFSSSNIGAFSLRSPQNIRIEIFNIAGQRVKIIANETMEMGNHKFTWDGTDNNATKLANGVYFYTITTLSGERVTKKLILLR